MFEKILKMQGDSFPKGGGGEAPLSTRKGPEPPHASRVGAAPAPLQAWLGTLFLLFAKRVGEGTVGKGVLFCFLLSDRSLSRHFSKSFEIGPSRLGFLFFFHRLLLFVRRYSPATVKG